MGRYPAAILLAGLILLIVAVSLACRLFPDTGRPAVERLVRAAVEDDSWMYACSKEDLEFRLQQYYSGSLLEELLDSTWFYIENPTDWYLTAVAGKVVSVKKGPCIMVLAEIRLEDAVTHETFSGEGLYTVKNTGSGWRIVEAAYSWESSGSEAAIQLAKKML